MQDTGKSSDDQRWELSKEQHNWLPIFILVSISLVLATVMVLFILCDFQESPSDPQSTPPMPRAVTAVVLNQKTWSHGSEK